MIKYGHNEDKDWRSKCKLAPIVIEEPVVETPVVVPPLTKKQRKAINDAKPAEVYVWHNRTLNKRYVGYKTLPVNDYIASSKNDQFWEDHSNDDYEWTREVLYEGSQYDCRKVEAQHILALRDSEMYNSNTMRLFIEQNRKQLKPSYTKCLS